MYRVCVVRYKWVPIYVYIANSMLHRSTRDREQSKIKQQQKKMWYSLQNGVYSLFCLRFSLRVLLVCRLSFILTFVYYNRTQHALISLTLSLAQSFIHGTAMSILFAHSTRPIAHSLALFAMLPSLFGGRAHTITHSSTRVPLLASTPCVRTLAHTYTLYTHIFFCYVVFI